MAREGDAGPRGLFYLKQQQQKTPKTEAESKMNKGE